MNPTYSLQARRRKAGSVTFGGAYGAPAAGGVGPGGARGFRGADDLDVCRELDPVTHDDSAEVEVLVPVQAEGLTIDAAVHAVAGAHPAVVVDP